ncbi:hypothetical protein RRG08_029489 [Elysia crispata]|uniref:Uncharacterized protein n=1 Tax=Elysia crispata TaxID=231223 RepID=A0AAE1DNJ8_9GAST|nr:hypothetical protein RRG08_029489 [Elysia crispata]
MDMTQEFVEGFISILKCVAIDKLGVGVASLCVLDLHWPVRISRLVRFQLIKCRLGSELKEGELGDGSRVYEV